MGLLDDIKNQVKKSGSNKAKFVYFKSGGKVRLRFLSNLEDGMKVTFHDSFALSINVPCQEIFGKSCSHCENEELRTRDQFLWPVWDYEANEVKIMMGAVNNFSPIPQLVAMYDTYGSMTDRDYVITKQGTQQSSSFSVVPMDKAKFRNEKAKAFSTAKMLQLLEKAFPDDASDDEEPVKGKGGSKKQASSDDDYDDMTAKELYDACIAKDIQVPARQPKQYYIDQLKVADDSEDDGWGDEEEPASVDLESMSAKELFDLCKERKIDVEPRKAKPYYIEKLEANRGAGDDDGWGEKDEDGDEW